MKAYMIFSSKPKTNLMKMDNSKFDYMMPEFHMP